MYNIISVVIINIRKCNFWRKDPGGSKRNLVAAASVEVDHRGVSVNIKRSQRKKKSLGNVSQENING